MKISYDPEVDALSITFRETTVTTKHLAEGIAADYDSEGRLAGLEILDAQKRFRGRETMRRVILERCRRLISFSERRATCWQPWLRQGSCRSVYHRANHPSTDSRGDRRSLGRSGFLQQFRVARR